MPVRKSQLAAASLPKPTGTTGAITCGFCESGHHRFCPVAIKNATGKAGGTWLCPCAMEKPEKHPKYRTAPR